MKSTDQETREYIERVEQDKSLPAGERLKLLTAQGLWSEKLWNESKAEVVPRLQAEIAKPVEIREEAKPQIPEATPVEEDLIQVKLSLEPENVKLMAETLNFLAKARPNLPSSVALNTLRWDKQLLSDLLNHLRTRGIIVI